MVAARESAILAEKLISETCAKQGITRGQLSLHADRGSSMTSKPVALLLADLGVTQSHSRPHVSNDNPYSEAQFKTLKYRPGFPARFGSTETARAHCQEFFPWYNNDRHHGGLGLHTAADIHHGHAPPSRQPAPRSWTPPTPPTLSASSASRPPRRNCQAHPGSTRPRRKKQPLSKRHSAAPQTG
jgi:putative transposase